MMEIEEPTPEPSGFGKIWKSVKTKYRFLVFIMTIGALFTDMSSRVGIPLAMIGGMVKSNCTDPNDEGEFCWSENFKATLLGAYFYGYTLQIVVITVAKKIGFNLMMRITVLLSAVIQLTFPVVIIFSPTLAVVLQALRGFSAGVIMGNNMEVARKWGIGLEGRQFISCIGMTTQFSMGAGPLLGGLITTSIGWRYYFYINGAAFVLISFLLVIFIPNSPLESWAMCAEEKRMFEEKLDTAKLNSTAAVNSNKTMSVKTMLSKLYAWAFSLYMMCQVFQFYGTIMNTPFYLNDILKAPPTLLSYLQLGLGIVASVSTYGFALILPKMDKRMSWLKCRMMFLLVPMLVRTVVFSIFPQVSNLPAAVALLVVKMISYATTFSGSIVTANYEMDPVNSAMILGMFNSFGQSCGFLSPMVMAWMTTIDKKQLNYTDVLKQRWSYFFYLNAGLGLVAVAVIVASLAVRPGEWKKHHSLVAEDQKRKTGKLGIVVTENRATSSTNDN